MIKKIVSVILACIMAVTLMAVACSAESKSEFNKKDAQKIATTYIKNSVVYSRSKKLAELTNYFDSSYSKDEIQDIYDIFMAVPKKASIKVTVLAYSKTKVAFMYRIYRDEQIFSEGKMYMAKYKDSWKFSENTKLFSALDKKIRSNIMKTYGVKSANLYLTDNYELITKNFDKYDSTDYFSTIESSSVEIVAINKNKNGTLTFIFALINRDSKSINSVIDEIQVSDINGIEICHIKDIDVGETAANSFTVFKKTVESSFDMDDYDLSDIYISNMSKSSVSITKNR